MNSGGKVLAVAGSALGRRINEQTGVHRKRDEPDVGHRVVMQPKFRRMFHHLGFGRRPCASTKMASSAVEAPNTVKSPVFNASKPARS